MDCNFMKSFYERYYENPICEAIADSEKYHALRKKRQEIEGLLEGKLTGFGNDLMQLFDMYMDAYSDEMEVVLQKIYLMGARDREQMLR